MEKIKSFNIQSQYLLHPRYRAQQNGLECFQCGLSLCNNHGVQLESLFHEIEIVFDKDMIWVRLTVLHPFDIQPGKGRSILETFLVFE